MKKEASSSVSKNTAPHAKSTVPSAKDTVPSAGHTAAHAKGKAQRARHKVAAVAVLMLAVVMVALTACGGLGQGADKVLRVGTNAEFPPFEYIDNDGEVAGFDADLIEAVAQTQGYRVEWANMEFKSLIGALESGGIDVAIAGMTITEARLQSVDFTDPYYDATQALVLLEGSTYQTIEELNGKKVAVQEGTTGDLMVTPGGEGAILTDPSTQVFRFKKGVDAILTLLNRAVDAVVIDATPAAEFVRANQGKIFQVMVEGEPEQYGIAVRKSAAGENQLLAELNEGLAKIRQDGTYDRLYEQYLGSGETAVGRRTSENPFLDFLYQLEFIFITNNGAYLMLQGLGVTLVISFFAILLGTALGFPAATVRMAARVRGKRSLGAALAGIYIDIIRGTPTVVQLLIMYMVIFNSRVGTIAAILTFGINSGAYVSEIVRSGIQAVGKGQTEAGRSLGFTYNETMRYIVMPQAVKNILPALGNEFITLIKETSIVGYVAIMDLTKAGDFLISRTYNAFIPLITVAIVYYLLIKVLTTLLGLFERRLNKSDNRY